MDSERKGNIFGLNNCDLPDGTKNGCSACPFSESQTGKHCSEVSNNQRLELFSGALHLNQIKTTDLRPILSEPNNGYIDGLAEQVETGAQLIYSANGGPEEDQW